MDKSTAPGEVPKAPGRRRLLTLLMVFAAVLGYWLASRAPANSPEMAREYELYRTEKRPDVQLDFVALSSVADESSLRHLLAGLSLDCRADWTGIPGATRSCGLDLKSLNGVPTMYVNFSFQGNRLMRVSTAVPAEAHERGRRYLEQAYGQPTASQRQKSNGLRLAGWTLNDGSTLFYNIDKHASSPSSIQWIPKNGCEGRPCIRGLADSTF
jgi:hypothetical protein